MKLEDAMQHLRMHEEPSGDRGSEAEILALVKARAEEFDRSIRRRDKRELIAAVFVFVVFSVVLVSASWLTRVGAIIVLGGCILTYLMLRRANGQAQTTAGLPLAEMLRAERAKVDAQIRLLRRVLWWYVAPFAVGPILVFAGIAGFGMMSAVYTVFAVALGAAIYHMNQQAVRNNLVPRRGELDRLLRQVEP
jgi:hypothetical protein